jgi:rubrerythrin
MELKGSQTEKNLLIAFAGESQARNRYTYYAGEAKKAGYEYIAAIFLETAENEKEHAKVFFKHLGEGSAEIVAGYPFHLGDTLSNLTAAAEGEHYEWTTSYQNFAIVADQEGFKDIAVSFREIAKVEHFHESVPPCAEHPNSHVQRRGRHLARRNCGYIVKGKEAPEPALLQASPQAYYGRCRRRICRCKGWVGLQEALACP